MADYTKIDDNTIEETRVNTLVTNYNYSSLLKRKEEIERQKSD